MEALAKLAERVRQGEFADADALHRAKLQVCREHGLRRVPANHELLAWIPEGEREAVRLLKRKPVRTASGVAVVAVMPSPARCPHGTCLYCPGGVTWGTPQAYTGSEPLARRAAQHGYEPRAQTTARLAQLHAVGHATGKVELLVIGGTFTARSPAYREAFVRACLEGLNGEPSRSLEEAHRRNEAADHRLVGLTVETKPDAFLHEEVEHSLRLGVTRVELGVQSLREDVLRFVNRGHGLREVVEATRRAKEAGLKVGYHMMPGLPGTSYEEDLGALRELFANPAYRPDMLKIYPVLVVEGTGLHRLWRQGRYREMDTATAARLLAVAKADVPPYVRIMRIQREIPAHEIEAGVTKGHLRQLIRERMEAQGRRCRCIRCREAGHRRAALRPEDVELGVLRYEASEGTEWFLSFEDFSRGLLVGYARLRLGAVATVRELRVAGQVVPLAQHPGARWQHRGYGKALMGECETMAEEAGYATLRVTSGVGVRPYYRKLGYRRAGPYMEKPLTPPA